MRTSLLRLAVALATFGLGVTLATLWLGLTTSSFKPSYKRDSCRFRQRAVLAPVPPVQPLPAVAPAPPAIETLKMETCETTAENPDGWTASGDSLRKTVSGGALNGKAVSKPVPEYPAAAMAARASGTVVVQITVDECGVVEKANAVSGHPLLRAAATDAAYKSQFTPTRLSGQPVKVTGMITYNFVLD